MPGDDAITDDLLDPTQVRSFGDYELREEIARGGMGVVYRAWQISLQREVAVKMILSGELAGKAALRLFQNEAHAAANLHHPNIVPVYEIGEHETQHYFTMRFVPGGETIADWASRRRGEFRVIAGAVARVARAVAHAHERGVLHRDLKPSNILWDPSDEPQVTDFGLAKVLASADGMATFSAQALGSPSYMAPEQMGGRTAEITTATDVYGLGAVLYELLSGKPPFFGASAIETMRRAADEAPAPLTSVPKDLRTICLKCLEKKQGDRYASAAALATDLEDFVRGEPVSAVPLTPPQVLLRWIARKPRVAALLALFIISLLVGVAGISWQWHRSEMARTGQSKTLAHLGWDQMTRWARTGEEPRALAYLASLIRERPGNWRAAMYAMSIVDQRSLPALAGPAIYPPVAFVPGTARLAPDGNWLAAADKKRPTRLGNGDRPADGAVFLFVADYGAGGFGWTDQACRGDRGRRPNDSRRNKYSAHAFGAQRFVAHCRAAIFRRRFASSRAFCEAYRSWPNECNRSTSARLPDGRRHRRRAHFCRRRTCSRLERETCVRLEHAHRRGTHARFSNDKILAWRARRQRATRSFHRR